MENALLIGLSRQIALQRELDVVANNIANLNTTGFKADGAVFEEFLMPAAQREPVRRADRRMSFVQDRTTWHDMSQGTIQQTGNPLDVAIDGERLLVVQTPRGERYTRNGALQINTTGQLVTIDGYKVLGENGPIVLQPTDRDIVITNDGTITVREGAASTPIRTRGKLRLVDLRQSAAAAEGRRLDLRGAERRAAAQADAQDRTSCRARSRNRTSTACVEMTRMIEMTRSLHRRSPRMLQQQSDMRTNRDPASSPKFRPNVEEIQSCAHFTPPRPE